MPTLWMDGELLDAADARISVLDRGVIWGYGLFETLRAYGGVPWAADEHLDRLEAGAERLGIAPPERSVLRAAMDAVLDAEGLAEAGVRVTVTGGTGPPEPHLDATGPPTTFVTAWAVPDQRSLWEHGAELITLPDGGRPLAGVKTTSYAASVVGRLEARRRGAEDALFTSPEGQVLEGTGSNVMVVRGEVLRTPPLDGDLLPGVTRGAVLAVAEDAGFVVEEGAVLVEELFEVDEVVLTSTLREVYPARRIDGRDVARGGASERLRGALRARIASATGVNLS